MRIKEKKCAETQELPPVLDPAEVYNQKITEEYVVECLDALPEVYRETLVLWHLEEMTAPQISEILDVPLSTVEGRLRHGRRMLRQQIGQGIKK